MNDSKVIEITNRLEGLRVRDAELFADKLVERTYQTANVLGLCFSDGSWALVSALLESYDGEPVVDVENRSATVISQAELLRALGLLNANEERGIIEYRNRRMLEAAADRDRKEWERLNEIFGKEQPRDD